MRQTSLSSIDQDTPDFNHLTEKREFTVTNKRNIPFTGEVYGKIISFSDIIFSPIPQLKCICCGFMGRTFYCHPNLPPYYSWKEKLSKYNFFMLIIGKINVRERYEDNLKSFKISEWRAGYFAGNEGTNYIKKRVRQRRIETINYLSAFTKIRFCDEGGGCSGNCRVCALYENVKCKKPDYTAPAPEAMGIDSYSMLSELEIPPKEDYHMLSMVYGNLKGDFKPTSLVPRPNNNGIIEGLNNVEAVYPVKEIWNPDQSKTRCEKCKFYSPFLCDRKHFRDEDLYNTIKDWHLYAIRLKNKINTQNAIKELHNYQLWTHRQGYWQSFQLLPVRCPICRDCSLETHMAGAYKKVQNRAIPFCVSYFNLDPKVKGENVGYILG